MLDSWIIDSIKQSEKEEEERRRPIQIPLYYPTDQYDSPAAEKANDSGSIVIDMM